jgi:hypothetical protein
MTPQHEDGSASPLRRWGYVFELHEDEGGGFAAGEFLLRHDGELLRRFGGASTGRDGTTWRFSGWERVDGWRGTDIKGCKRWLRGRGYDLFDPGPVPVDRQEIGPSPGPPRLARPLDD